MLVYNTRNGADYLRLDSIPTPHPAHTPSFSSLSCVFTSTANRPKGQLGTPWPSNINTASVAQTLRLFVPDLHNQPVPYFLLALKLLLPSPYEQQNNRSTLILPVSILHTPLFLLNPPYTLQQKCASESQQPSSSRSPSLHRCTQPQLHPPTTLRSEAGSWIR